MPLTLKFCANTMEDARGLIRETGYPVVTKPDAGVGALDALFREKSIPAWVDFWGYDVNHDWPWWYKQMNYFLQRLYG